MSDESEKEGSEQRKKRSGERREQKVSVERRCDGFVAVEAFEIFSQGRDLESCGGLSWWDLLEKLEDLFDFEPDTRVEVQVVLDVTDVLVSRSSVVTEFCDGFLVLL